MTVDDGQPSCLREQEQNAGLPCLYEQDEPTCSDDSVGSKQGDITGSRTGLGLSVDDPSELKDVRAETQEEELTRLRAAKSLETAEEEEEVVQRPVTRVSSRCVSQPWFFLPTSLTVPGSKGPRRLLYQGGDR